MQFGKANTSNKSKAEAIYTRLHQQLITETKHNLQDKNQPRQQNTTPSSKMTIHICITSTLRASVPRTVSRNIGPTRGLAMVTEHQIPMMARKPRAPDAQSKTSE